MTTARREKAAISFGGIFRVLAPVRSAILAAIGFAALALLSACAGGYNPDAYAGWSLRRAQDACNAGDAGACAAANYLRMQDVYSL